MPTQRSLLWPIVTILIAAFVVFTALPQNWKTWAPGFFGNAGLHLGLDLAGGTQLDFRISEEEIRQQLDHIDTQIREGERSGMKADDLSLLRAQRKSVEDQQSNLVEAIRTVLERRINALGVSEAVITPSYLGQEKHLLVECPGVVDVQECIKVVGKTIQLEFKEEFTVATDDFRNDVRTKVATTLRRMTRSGASLQQIGQDQGSQLDVTYLGSTAFFRDLLPKGLENLWNVQPGGVVQKDVAVDCRNAGMFPVEFLKQYCTDANGQFAANVVPGIALTQVLRPLTATGRVLNVAGLAFAQLAKTEEGALFAHKENWTLDTSVDSRITGALRQMQNGELRAVATGDDAAAILFLQQLRPGAEQFEASHILVAYKGAAEAGAGVTRTRAEAQERVDQLKKQLDGGANFESLARAQSDGPSRASGGRLGPIARGVMGTAFENAALALKPGRIGSPVETPYGFHLIRLDKAAFVTPSTADVDMLTVKGPGSEARAQTMAAQLQAGEVRASEPALTVRLLLHWLTPSGWKDTELDGKHFRHASVTMDQTTNAPVVQIAFDGEGAKLFQELTKRNIGKRVAIYVGGEQVTAPRVNEEISGGTAVISGNMDLPAAQALAQDLNTGAIPAPIHLTGQYTIEATLGDAALQTSLLAGFIGIVILMLYMMVVYRLLGVAANLGLIIFAFILFAILKLPLLLFTSNYIVLTLAGMAGVILSIGMAVDANVLVFERMKEELRRGRSLKSALEAGFKHAWPAIRDGNVSTIITCVILFMVGTSIVRGFAVTLGMGVVLSLFTAITVTRWILRHMIEMPFAQNLKLYGVKKPPEESQP